MTSFVAQSLQNQATGTGNFYPGNFYQTVTVNSATTAGNCLYYQAFDLGTTQTVTNSQYSPNWMVTVDLAPETEEQRLEREQRERDFAAKEKARHKRARAALFVALTKCQRRQFAKHEHFELEVNQRLYRVRRGARVERLDPQTKKVLSYFCIHPSHEHELPSEDVALSQKLWLETNEAEFLRVANETRAA